MAIGFSLHRERLSKVEGDGIGKVSGLLGSTFLLGRLGFRRGRGSLGLTLAFGSFHLFVRGRGLGSVVMLIVSSCNRGACQGLDAVQASLSLVRRDYFIAI